MARARSFANVTACRAVSNPAWCRIFREISCFSPLNIGTLFRCCVLGQDTLPWYASLDSGVNEYLVGQSWQCVRLVPSAEMAASAVCSKKGVEMVHEWTGPLTRGNMCEAHRALYVRYIRTHHYLLLLLLKLWIAWSGWKFRLNNLSVKGLSIGYICFKDGGTRQHTLAFTYIHFHTARPKIIFNI